MRSNGSSSWLVTGHRRGAAMMEFVLVLPLLLMVLMLLFYFGRGFVRLQHAQVMTHYEAWRQSSPAPPQAGVPAPGNDPEHRVMNQTFLGGSAQSLDFDHGGSFPRDTTQALAQYAGYYHPDADDLALLTARGDGGYSAMSKITYTETRPLWSRFNGPIRLRHVIDGGDWAMVRGWRLDDQGQWQYDPHQGGSPALAASLRDLYFAPLDQRLAATPSVNNRANPVASGVRNLYLGQPGYRGPQVTPP